MNRRKFLASLAAGVGLCAVPKAVAGKSYEPGIALRADASAYRKALADTVARVMRKPPKKIRLGDLTIKFSDTREA